MNEEMDDSRNVLLRNSANIMTSHLVATARCLSHALNRKSFLFVSLFFSSLMRRFLRSHNTTDYSIKADVAYLLLCT